MGKKNQQTSYLRGLLIKKLVTRTGIELNFSHFLTCRDMSNSLYLWHFLTLTRFIMLPFILSF